MVYLVTISVEDDVHVRVTWVLWTEECVKLVGTEGVTSRHKIKYQ